MSLSPGSRVGPYEVVAAIGKGGMGEVFRARDARLKRDVALKILPAASVGNADSRSRFEREAQVLASLNHPSIAQVFGVEADGSSPVIVMEFVEGPTLADRIAKGALPLDDTIAIARQLCEGLEAAHERGVVHRDLKPANIKVRPDGTIKILDFGLARVLTEDTPIDASNSPTMLGAGRGTTAGLILGTAAYMSPEQARGRAVDKRADIWAFGAVVYEMLTGGQAFSGESITDVLAHIVERDPDWSKLPASAHGRVEELLRRCLQKNLKDRLRDIGDARFELEASQSRAALSGPRPRPSSWLTTSIAFTAGAIVAAAAAVLLMRTSPAAPPAAVRTTLSLPPGITLQLSRGSAVAVSPDGHTIAFPGNAQGKVQLYLRHLDRFELQPLGGTDEAASPFFSPDGRWIGFFAGDKLKRVSVEGGAPVTITDARTPRGEAWGPNEEIFLTPSNNSPVNRIQGLGGKLERVTTLQKAELSHRWPFLLPDGSAILFAIWNDLGWEPSRIEAQSLKTGERRTVVEAGGGYPRYIRDAGTHGYLVYARTEGLLAAPFDESRLAVTGAALPVVDSVVTNLSGGAHFDLSPSGTLAYVPGDVGEADRELDWVTRDGKATVARRIRGLSRGWTLSADGNKVLRNNTVGDIRDIWIEDLAAGTSARITAGTNPQESYTNMPVWTPDGQWVIYEKGTPVVNLYRRRSNGGGGEERLTTSKQRQEPGSVSPDGKWLAYIESDPVSGSDIWILPLQPVSPPRAYVNTSFAETYPAFSPDGRWIAYQSNDSGRFEIFVRSFPDGQSAFRVSTGGGLAPQWAPSGRELLFRSSDNRMMVSQVSTAAGFQSSPPRMLFDARQYENSFALAPDGQRLLMMPLIVNESAATQINVVQNFLSELRQRVR